MVPMVLMVLPAATAAAQSPYQPQVSGAASQPITLRSPTQTLAPTQTLTATEQWQGSAGGEVANGSPLEQQDTSNTLATPLVTIASSLAIVLGLFAALVWVTRRAQRGAPAAGSIPDGTLRVLGQKSLGSLGTVSLVRCGRRVLVVSSSASGVQALATISDEAEVRELEAACLGGGHASFQQVLSEISRQEPPRSQRLAQ